MKTLLKWFFSLLLLVVVLVVVFFLSLDSILRVVMVNRIRAQTGMDAEIGKFHLGLLEPVVAIKDLKLHNPPAFGGTPFLDLAEIHLEYDRDALAKNQIHLTLVRFNLRELDIVKNEAGQTNLFSLGRAVPAKGAKGGRRELKLLKQRTNLDFKGIDVLNVSVGTFKFIDLKNPRNNREAKLDIENLVKAPTKDKPYAVDSFADLAGIAVLVEARGHEFFKSILGVNDDLQWFGLF